MQLCASILISVHLDVIEYVPVCMNRCMFSVEDDDAAIIALCVNE